MFQRKSLRPLDLPELLELFKHLDTRVSHQELLFVPLSLAFIPAVLIKWEEISKHPLLVLAAAVASLGVYILHLLIINRFAVFQTLIFKEIKEKYISNWDDVIENSMGRIGVQWLRVLALPCLGAIWALILYETKYTGTESPSYSIVFLIGLSLLVTLYLLPKTDKDT